MDYIYVYIYIYVKVRAVYYVLNSARASDWCVRLCHYFIGGVRMQRMRCHRSCSVLGDVGGVIDVD